MPPGNLYFAAHCDDYLVDGLFRYDWTRLADHHPPLPKLLALDEA